MKIAAIIVTLLCCCLMFLVKRETKAALLVMGAMTLTLVSVPVIPLHKANILLQVAFLLSEWHYLPIHFKRLRRTPNLMTLLLIISTSALIVILTSPYVKVISFLQTELLFKYFALAYAFWAVKDEKSLKPVLRISIFCLIVLTILGVMNYMTKHSVFVNALTEGKTSLVNEDIALGDVYAEKVRFRVQSMFKSAFDYGYICAAILLLHLYALHRGLEKRKSFLLALGCCLFGIVTCECRIVWLCSILSVCGFYLWCFPLRKTVLVGILAVSTIIIMYSTIDIVEEKVDKVIDVFKENPDTKGSSIELRMRQLAITIFYIDGHELFGLGQGYWIEGKFNGTVNVEGLLGLESVIFHHLLERGIVGFVLWFFFYAWLFCVFWRNRKKKVFLTGLGVSVLIVYCLFSIGTGELSSVYSTMLLSGMVLKVIEYNKTVKKNRIKNENTYYYHQLSK